jgi:predicted dehydrogenase
MSGNNENSIGLGVIGFGGFALFAIQHVTQIQGIKLVGYSSTHKEAAEAAAKRFGARYFHTVEEMLDSPEIDLVYIATPPFLHYEHSMQSLKAGKHVICEKPLTINMDEAKRMIALAKEKELVMAVNLMQRYNPVYQMTAKLIASGILGEPLHLFFENYASDEFLPAEHWFWDKSKSGGIFIEHGVHFFDMFDGWLGKGKITSAQSVHRPFTDFEEQVQCQAIYDDSILANFFHSFTQPSRLDRQELRILFEKAEMTLYEWIPYKLRINGVANEEDTKKLMDIFPGSVLNIEAFYMDYHRKMSHRHKQDNIYQSFSLNYGFDKKKMFIYGDIVKALFQDQVDYIRDKSHKRIITEENGLNSLAYACSADNLASAIRNEEVMARNSMVQDEIEKHQSIEKAIEKK